MSPCPCQYWRRRLGLLIAARALRVTVAFAATIVVAVPLVAATVPGTLKVTVEPPHLLVGDQVIATVSLSLPEDSIAVDPRFPDWSHGWGKAEILVASPVTIEGDTGHRIAVQRLTLTAFEPGKIELPPVEVTWGESQKALTPAGLSIEVRSVLAADDQELKPAAPAPPRALPISRTVWVAIGVAFALAVASGVLAWRRKSADDSLASPTLAPFAELSRALALLGARSPDEAFRGLSTALRRYLGRSFSIRALESSSSEIQRRLVERGVERELVQRALQSLRLADQVKFARRPATAADAAQRIAEATDLATTIEARLNPVMAETPHTESAKQRAVSG